MLTWPRLAAIAASGLFLSSCGVFSDGDGDRNFCHFEAQIAQSAYDNHFREWADTTSRATRYYYANYGHLAIVNNNLYYFADVCGSDPLSIWAPASLRDEITLTELSREEFGRRVDAVVIEAHPPPADFQQ